MTKRDQRAKLEALLSQAFTPAELELLLRRSDRTRPVADAVAFQGRPAMLIVHDVIEALTRHDVVDAEFRKSLSDARPARQSEIEAVWAVGNVDTVTVNVYRFSLQARVEIRVGEPVATLLARVRERFRLPNRPPNGIGRYVYWFAERGRRLAPEQSVSASVELDFDFIDERPPATRGDSSAQALREAAIEELRLVLVREFSR